MKIIELLRSGSAPGFRRWVCFCVFWATLQLYLSSFGQWTEPELFPVDHGTAIRGPWISSDDLRMYAAFTGYIFVAERASVDSPWTPFHTVGDNINSGIRQESPCESPTGDTLYFMSYERPEGTYGSYDIYYTILTDSGWFGPIVNCGANINSAFMEWSVGISRDGTKLLICSDRIPGGTMNLYYCDKQPNGTWGELASFGSNINSGRDEEHPTLSSDNSTLFFYKLGPRNGDIWVSHFIEEWQPAQNLSDPPNSLEWTESDPCLSADGCLLYFISNRAEGPGYQLYVTTDTALAVDERRHHTTPLEVKPTLFAYILEDRSIGLTLVAWSRPNQYEAIITDLLGRTLFRDRVLFDGHDGTLRATIRLEVGWSAGPYFIRVDLKTKMVSQRFDIQR